MSTEHTGTSLPYEPTALTDAGAFAEQTAGGPVGWMLDGGNPPFNLWLS